MKTLVSLLFGLLICLLVACDYEITGYHFEELDPNPPIVADITLEDHTDTIFVRGDVNLKFTITLPGRTFYGYQLLLDNTVITSGNSTAVNYKFQSKKYSDGYHHLKLMFAGSAGTGSLADKSGLEGVEVYRTWVIHIDNAPPPPPAPVAITRIYPADGQLRVEWQRTGIPNFGRYELVRYFEDGYSQVVATITSSDSTSWVDPKFVAGTARYKVVLYEADNFMGIHGNLATYSYPVPRILHSSYNQDNALTITFSSTPFYKNFREYEFTIANQRFAGTTVHTDTVITIPDPGFGIDFNLLLTTYHKELPLTVAGRAVSSGALVPGYGIPWGHPWLSTYTMRPKVNRIYSLTSSQIKILDPVTFQVVRERDLRGMQHDQYGFTKNVVSEDGRYLYSILNNEQLISEIHRLDPVTLQTMEIFKFGQLLGGYNYGRLNLQGVSNTNRLLIGAMGAMYKDSVFLVDMEQKKLLDKKLAMTFPGTGVISPDGKAMQVYMSTYLEQSDGNWKVHVPTAQKTFNRNVHPLKPEFFVSLNRSIVFYATETGEQLRTIAVESELYNLAIDPASGLLTGTANGMFYVYNPETGHLVRRIKQAVNLFLYGDKIYSNTHYLPI